MSARALRIALSPHLLAVLVPAALGAWALVAGAARIRPEMLKPAPDAVTRVDGETFPLTFTNPGGARTELRGPPRRIASCVLAADEILLDLVPAETLVLATSFADSPGWSNIAGRVLESTPRITHADPETILATRPDLVVVAGFSDAETVRLLSAAEIPVIRLKGFDAFVEIETHIRRLGAVTGQPAQARALIDGMRERLQAVAARVEGRPRPRILFSDGLGYSAGPGSLLDEMIERAGGHNLARDLKLQGLGPIAKEAAVASMPEILVVQVSDESQAQDRVQAILDDALWQATPAVRNGRVYALPARHVQAVTHHAVKGVEGLARCLHPEAFGQ